VTIPVKTTVVFWQTLQHNQWELLSLWAFFVIGFPKTYIMGISPDCPG
jgi:hypothetical protein